MANAYALVIRGVVIDARIVFRDPLPSNWCLAWRVTDAPAQPQCSKVPII